MRSAILAPAALAFAAACSSGQLREPDPPNVSPGTVTLRLLLPSTQTFCDQTIVCTTPQHIVISREAGASSEIPMVPMYYAPACAPQCGDANECFYNGCAPACQSPVGVAVTNVETTWDGLTYEWSSCRGGITCYDRRYVPPGRYFARMCVTPGTLSVTDGSGAQTCTATAAEQCVDVPFDLPGSGLIEVPLPS
jgi:hypothetical protein